jgi:hypothetical protein
MSFIISDGSSGDGMPPIGGSTNQINFGTTSNNNTIVGGIFKSLNLNPNAMQQRYIYSKRLPKLTD